MQEKIQIHCSKFFFFSFSSQISPLEFYTIVLFIKDLKAKLKYGRSKLGLTMSFSVSNNFNVEKYELSTLSKYVDFMSFIQIYSDPSTEYLTINEALQARAASNVEQKVIDLLESVVPSTKIVIGVQFGGPELFTTMNANYRASKLNAILSYNSICNLISNETLKWEWQNYNGLTLLKNKNESRVIVFESTRSIANRMRFVVSRNLAGVVINSIDMDDFSDKGKIDEDTFDDFEISNEITMNFQQQNGTNFPLLRTINAAIITAISETSKQGNFENISDEIIISNHNQSVEHSGNETDSASKVMHVENVLVFVAFISTLSSFFYV